MSRYIRKARVTMSRGIALLFVLAIVAALLGPSQTQAQTPSTNVEKAAIALFDAMSTGDVQGSLRLFSESASLEGFGFCPGERCTGRSAIQTGLQLIKDERMRFVTLQPVERSSETRAIGQVHVLSDSIQRGGAPRLVFHFEAEMANSLFVRLRLTPVLSDPATASFLGIGSPASVGPSLATCGWRRWIGYDLDEDVRSGFLAPLVSTT